MAGYRKVSQTEDAEQTTLPSIVENPDTEMQDLTQKAAAASQFSEYDADTEKQLVSTEKCGPITVYVQGDLRKQEQRAVFLTVHDMGCNHSSFHDFVDRPCMSSIKERSVFVHIDVPGQEDNAGDLTDDYQFPTMQTLGEELGTVLDELKVKYVIGIGEGAGANILARFGMAHPTRVLGLILIHCTSTVAGIMEYFKDKLLNWKLSSVGMHPSAEQYLVFHKFGHQLENVSAKDKDRVIQEYQQKLRSTINPRNLKRYVEAFMNRTDLSDKLSKNLKVDTLLVTGGKASHVHTIHTMHCNMDKTKTSLLKVDGVGDVINEAPEKFAQSILLFAKGLGQLTSVTMPGVERQRTFSGGSCDGNTKPRRQRTISMEEYDKPNIRRLSVTKKD